LDRDGNLYVADRPYRIRKITLAGIISTVVGTGYPGIAADGRTAISSPLSNPSSVAVDDLGNLYFVEGGARIRKVTTDGMIDTVFGAAPGPVAYTSVAVNKAGDLYIANPLNSRILKVAPGAHEPVVVAGTGVRGISGDEGPATSAQLSSPSQIAIDRLGNLYINDSDWRRIRKVTSDGIIHTIQPQSGVAGVYVGPTLANSPGLAIDADGDIYVVQAGNFRSVVRAMPDGRITPAVLWHGEVEPVVVGQGAKPISARATLNSDGHLSYLVGNPRIVLENAGRIDASVSLTPVSPCKFEFGVARAETPASVLFSQKGAGPVLNVAGDLESGTYNLVLWFQRGDTTCKNGTSLVLRYLVTVTPR
jgi:sugar lactone lactonase YvrE